MFRSIWRRNRNVELGRKWHGRVHQSGFEQEHTARRSFLKAFAASDGDGRVRLGRADDAAGKWHWCELSAEELLKSHILETGATGMGKSRLNAAILYQVLRAGHPVVIVDNKSELSEIVLDTLAPALIASGVKVGPIRVVRPFLPGVVPLLRLTEPEPGVSREVQALTLAASLGEAVGEDLKIRMHRAFLRMSSLAIEKNLPLTILPQWASSAARFAQDARTSTDHNVRQYAREFAKENRSTLDGLRARLDELFHLKEICLALSADRCLSFPECLESGLTVFDFGSPPAGAEMAMKFISAPLLGRLTRAILSRPVNKDTKSALVLYEEFQESLGKHAVDQFKRLLALSRFKKCALLFSNQQPAQIKAVDPMLLRILRTNVGIEAIFRSSAEDAADLSRWLTVRRPSETQTAARARFTESIVSLPKRSYYLWAKDYSFGPQEVRSPKLDLEELDKIAAKLSDSERAEIRRGCVCVPADQVHEIAPEYVEEELKAMKKTKGLG